MPAKTASKAAPKAPKASAGGGKSAKKKKWSKGKAKEKLNNLVLFDKATYDKLLKEVPSYKLITVSILSERLKITGSLAKKAIKELRNKGLIRPVSTNSAQIIYTRTPPTEKEKEAAKEVVAEEKPKAGAKKAAPKKEEKKEEK